MRIHLKDESLYEEQNLIVSLIINEQAMGQTHRLNMIIRENPKKGWRLILKALREIPSEYLHLEFIDGPMRLFLHLHGKEYIETIEREALEHPSLQKAISRIIKYEYGINRIEEDVLLRLKSISIEQIDSKRRFSDASLINSWLIYTTTFWAGEELRHLVCNDPEKAWLITLELISQAKNLGTLSYIAAATLEHILSYHGPEFIEHVESKASESKRFRLCLSGVWQMKISDEIWKRVRKACGDEDIDRWDGAIPDN